MNKHIAKLRDHLVREMERLTIELAETAAAIHAIDALDVAKAAVVQDGRKRAWTPERRAAMSAKMKAQHESNPETQARRAAALERARLALTKQRANGADSSEWHA